MNHKKEFKLDFGGKEITLETGRLAKQADGAVMISSGKTQVLATVCSAHEVREGQDWFPLTVDYTEKFYSAGKFLGGFMKRETRPSTSETLNARLTDRPLRPLFPKGYMFDTFIQINVLSYEEEHDQEVLGSLAAAAAVNLSDIPFAGSLGTCKVGKIDGKLVLNPGLAEWENSTLELLVSASKEAILMVEGEADEISEEEMLEAIDFAHEHIKKFCIFLDKIMTECGKTKREFTPVTPNETLAKKVESDFSNDAKTTLAINDKLERQQSTAALNKKVTDAIKENPENFGLTEECSSSKEAHNAVDGLLYNILRGDILKEGKRIGNRGTDEVRKIEVESDLLKTPHGSALFTRGETQVLATATLGSAKGDQMVDRITGTTFQKFYLHYNFPPFSVGEARGIRGVSRRELGHGNLAERAIRKVLPSPEDFGYTIRVCCEVLESNGSSSMGSVCSGSMALMDAGVPLKKAVAGVAMGLVKEGDDYKILTDILGDEDHLGDMDFKIAGSSDGITAIQMDIKISGITREIFSKALIQAKVARLHILNEMSNAISSNRVELKEGIPIMEQIKIAPDKIGALIGPGGKNIKALQEEFEATIECQEDGTIKLLAPSKEQVIALREVVDMQINGPKIGEIYPAVVVTIKEYGAFVDIAPGVSGLVHVSEIANERVKDVNEYLTEGEKVDILVKEKDDQGRLKFSIKAVKSLSKKS